MSRLQLTTRFPKIISILRLFILSISSYQMLLRCSISSSFCTPSPPPSSLSFLVTQPSHGLFSRIVFKHGESQSPTTMTTQSSRFGDTALTQRARNLNCRHRHRHRYSRNTHHSSSSSSNNVADVVDNPDDDTEAEVRRKETDLKRLQFELAQYRSALEEKELRCEKVQGKVERLEKEEATKLVSLEGDDKVEDRISVFREERDTKQKRLNSLLLQQREIETILLQNLTDLETQRSETTETLQTKITNLTTEIERAQLQLDSITTTNTTTTTSNGTNSPLSPRLTAIAPDIATNLINNLQSIRNSTSERLLSIQEDLIYIRRYYARKCSDLRASLTTAQSDYASIRSQTDLLRADVKRLEGMLQTVPAELQAEETEIRRKIEELRENDQRRDREHRESMGRMVRGFGRRIQRAEDFGEADTEGLKRALAAELTGLQRTLEERNELVGKGMNEELEVCRDNAAEEVAEARRKWRGEMRNVTRTGMERIRALREGGAREVSEVTARLEADIEADIRRIWEKNERVLKKIQREKEEALEALEFKKKAELKQYKMYEMDMMKKLINLNAEREELQKLVVDREELLVMYEEDKKSFRKLLRLIMKVAWKRTVNARKRLIKRISR